MTKKSELRYGKKELIDGDLPPQEAKVKVTIYLDGDLLLEIRRLAKKSGKKYQTFINESLRQQFFGVQHAIDPDEFHRLAERVSILEKAVSSE